MKKFSSRFSLDQALGIWLLGSNFELVGSSSVRQFRSVRSLPKKG